MAAYIVCADPDMNFVSSWDIKQQRKLKKKEKKVKAPKHVRSLRTSRLLFRYLWKELAMKEYLKRMTRKSFITKIVNICFLNSGFRSKRPHSDVDDCDECLPISKRINSLNLE